MRRRHQRVRHNSGCLDSKNAAAGTFVPERSGVPRKTLGDKPGGQSCGRIFLGFLVCPCAGWAAQAHQRTRKDVTPHVGLRTAGHDWAKRDAGGARGSKTGVRSD